jgi:GntR family transcriptional regulator
MSIKPFNTSPLYVQLRTDLTRRIARGDWKRGDNIPNELELAREYGLSPGTVRKALDWMEELRLIVRQQGRGTFVATPSSEELNARFERLRTSRGESVQLEMHVLDAGPADATAVEAERLKISPRAQVFKTTRVRLARGKPLMVEQLAVALNMFPSLSEAPPTYDLADLSHKDGILLGHGTESLSLVAADDRIADPLGIEPGTRVLLLERTIFTIDDHPAEWRQCWCNLEGYRYQVELN